jgi:hypothetical protein
VILFDHTGALFCRMVGTQASVLQRVAMALPRHKPLSSGQESQLMQKVNSLCDVSRTCSVCLLPSPKHKLLSRWFFFLLSLLISTSQVIPMLRAAYADPKSMDDKVLSVQYLVTGGMGSLHRKVRVRIFQQYISFRLVPASICNLMTTC